MMIVRPLQKALMLTLLAAPAVATAQYELSWVSIAGGGGTSRSGGYGLACTIGQHAAGTTMDGGPWSFSAGFWPGPTAAPPCYANCDNSTTPPILNVEDFTCFINAFAAGQALPPQEQIMHYANCDGSTTVPVLNVEDFACFITRYAQGCP